MHRSFFKWLVISAFVGIVLSVLFLAADAFQAHYGYKIARELNLMMRFLWPSSIWLMATDGIEGSAKDYLFMAIAIVGNGVFYSVIGSLIWVLKNISVVIRRMH